MQAAGSWLSSTCRYIHPEAVDGTGSYCALPGRGGGSERDKRLCGRPGWLGLAHLLIGLPTDGLMVGGSTTSCQLPEHIVVDCVSHAAD